MLRIYISTLRLSDSVVETGGHCEESDVLALAPAGRLQTVQTVRHSLEVAMETAQTADYALQVLDLLEHQDGRSIAEIATHLELSRSVAQRVVVTLHKRAMVIRSEDGRYWLGPALIRLAANLPHPLAALAQAQVDELGSATGETVVLAVPVADSAEVVLARPGDAGQLRVEYEVGFTHALVRGASGLAMLAFLSPDARARIGGADLSETLDTIRTAGFARTAGQLRPHMEGLAVPIRHAGSVLGSLALVVPTTRAESLTALLPDLIRAAAGIEAACDDHPGAVAALSEGGRR